MMEIYTPMAGDLLEAALNSLTLLIADNTFHSALNIAMTLGVGAMAYQYVMGKKLQSIMRFLVMSFVVLFILIGIKVPVAIIDMQRPMDTHVVDKVPLGVALPAFITSTIGYGIAKTFDAFFHMPDDLTYNSTGMVFGNRVMLAASGANFGTSPELSQDLSSYMRQCVWIGKVQVANNLTIGQMVKSNNLMETLFANPAVNYHVILHDKGNVDCPTAAKYLHGELVTAAQKEQKRLAANLTDGDTARFDNSLSASQQQLMNVSQAGGSLLIQNMLINKARNSVQDAMDFTGNDATLMNYTNTNSLNRLRLSEANSFWIAGYRLPMLATCLWILLICLFPVVILLGFFPVFQKAYTGFVMTMVYVWTWPPMFTIINFFVSFYASHKMTLFGHESGGITMANTYALNSVNSDMALTAGFLAMLVPFLAKSLATGLAGGFSSLSQVVTGSFQSISGGVAGGVSEGNVSVEQFSGWNANYDNTNAHKHDINSTWYRGNYSTQLASGVHQTSTADGHTLINTNAGMSHLAVSATGSQAVVSQLTHSAQEAQHRGDQMRTMADQSQSAGIREGTQFIDQHSNDYRAGAGQSVNDQFGIVHDYQSMYNALQGWNQSHDASKQISFGQALDASIGIGLGRNGVSANTNLRHDHSHSDNFKAFMDSQEGQRFSSAFSHSQSAAKNIHEDGSMGHHLSAAEQSSVDLNKARNFSQQASSEYAKSENYTKAASVAESNSNSIQTNFSNEFQGWAEQKYGKAQADDILSQTQGAGLATAQGWANEFLQTETGKGFLNSEVNSTMLGVKSNVTTDAYQKQSASLEKVAGVNELNNLGKQAVGLKSGSVSHLTSRQQASLEKQMAQAQHREITQQANITKSEVMDASHRIKHEAQNKIDSTQSNVKEELNKNIAIGDAETLAGRMISGAKLIL